MISLCLFICIDAHEITSSHLRYGFFASGILNEPTNCIHFIWAVWELLILSPFCNHDSDVCLKMTYGTAVSVQDE